MEGNMNISNIINEDGTKKLAEMRKLLFEGIKKHLIEYAEDHKEYQFDEDPEIEINQMYYAMSEHEEDPQGDYEL